MPKVYIIFENIISNEIFIFEFPNSFITPNRKTSFSLICKER